MDVVVIGGGVIGCAIARSLAGSGMTVALAERQRIGAGASAAAAGMLAPLAESSHPGPFSRLALLGLRVFKEQADTLVAESGVDIEYRRDGILRVAESAEEEESLRAVREWQTPAGIEVEWLDAEALRDLEPHLSHGICGALYTPGEGHVNPARLATALANAAAHRGARIMEGCSIDGFELHGDRVLAARHTRGELVADHFVIANGAWAGLWSNQAGIRLPVFPVRGQMVALGAVPAPIRRIVYSSDGYLVPKPDGSIYVGATEEEDAGFDASVTAAGLRWLLSAAERLVPALESATVLRSWAGLRPCAPDRLPIIGPLPGFANVTAATAHFRNGILLSLITGRLIAEQIVSGHTSMDLSPYSPARLLQSA